MLVNPLEDYGQYKKSIVNTKTIGQVKKNFTTYVESGD